MGNVGTPNKRKANDTLSDQQFHQACGQGVDNLIIKCMKAQSLDNLSIVMIGLKGFKIALE